MTKSDLEAWLYGELFVAYLAARRGKRRTRDEHLFEINLSVNLMNLTHEIINHEYKPGRGIAFVVKDPVVREIFAAQFRDRIVHHLLYNWSAEWWERHLDRDSYSCRKGKGTLYGVRQLQHYMLSMSNNGRNKAYVIKLDIQGYFMSLPRKGLYERIMWGLKRQFNSHGLKYELSKYLWREIIFDDPTLGVQIRGRREYWRLLPKNKSMFHQPEGQGIVIGNLTSQLLSNIYLDQLDRFVKFELGYKAYGRYVDDFFIIVDDDHYHQALRDIKAMEEFLLSINLVLHPKKRYIQEINQGVQFTGAIVYPNRILPGRRLQVNFAKGMRQVAEGNRSPDSVPSYMGLVKHFKHKKLEKEIFDSLGWDYQF